MNKPQYRLQTNNHPQQQQRRDRFHYNQHCHPYFNLLSQAALAKTAMDEYANSARQHRSFAQYVETRDVNNKTERRIEFAEIPFIHSSGGGEWSLASDRSACRLHVAIMCLPLLERTLVSLTDKPCLIHSTILFYAYDYWQLILVPLLLTTPP